MGLEIPPEVQWLSWIIGQDWPEGDETAMRRLATAWQDAANAVDEVTSSTEGAARGVLSVVQGPAADQFHQFWDKMVTADPEYLPKLAKACRSLAQQCDDGANDIEYGKYMFIALLIVTAIQIAILIANMIETFGASAAGIPVVEGAAQVASRTIARQLLMAILKSVAWSELQSVGLDALVQGLQMAEGHRHGWDWGKTGNAAINGAVNGVIGGAAGFGAGKIPGLSGAESPFKGMVQGAARDALSGAASGVAGSVVSTAIQGGDLSPDSLLKAATSGGFGGAIGGAKGGMHDGAHSGGSHGDDAPIVNDGGSPTGSDATTGSDGSSTGSDGSSTGSDGTGGLDGSSTGSDGSSGSNDGGSSGGHADAPSNGGVLPGTNDHPTGNDGGGSGSTHSTSSGGTSVHVGSDGGGSSASHYGSGGGGSSSSAAPHVTSDGGGHPSGGGGSAHTVSAGDTSSGTPHTSSGTNLASYDAGPPAGDGGGAAGGSPSFNRIDSLLNGPSTGGSGQVPSAPAQPGGFGDAGSTPAAAPPLGGMPGSGTPDGPGRMGGGVPAGGSTPPGGLGPGGTPSTGGTPSPGGGVRPSAGGDGVPSRGNQPSADRPGDSGRRPHPTPDDGHATGTGTTAPAPDPHDPPSTAGVPSETSGTEPGRTPGGAPDEPPTPAEPRAADEPRPADGQDADAGAPSDPAHGGGTPPPEHDGGTPDQEHDSGTEPAPSEPRPQADDQGAPADRTPDTADGEPPTPEPAPHTDDGTTHTEPPTPEATPHTDDHATPADRTPDATGGEPPGHPDAGDQHPVSESGGPDPAPPDPTTPPDPAAHGSERADGTPPAPPDAVGDGAPDEPPAGVAPDGTPADGHGPSDHDPNAQQPGSPVMGPQVLLGFPAPHDGAAPRMAVPDRASVTPDERLATPRDGSPSSTPPGDEAGSRPYTVGPSGDPVGLHEHAVPGDYHDCGDGIGTNDARAKPLLEDYRPWGDLPDKAAFDAAHRPGGKVNWPPNEGAAGPARRVTLPAGTVLDRFGYPGGEYLSPLGPDGRSYSFGDRAILPDSLAKGYHIYVLDAPVTVDLADVAPAFEQDGGGRQVKLAGTDLSALLDDGLVHEVTSVPPDGLVIPSDYGITHPDGTVSEPVSVTDAAHQHAESLPGDHSSRPETPGHQPPAPSEPHPGHADDPAHPAGDEPHHDAGQHGTDAGDHPTGDVPENLPEHLHDVYQASEETPAGRSLYPDHQQAMRDLAQRVQADPNTFVLDGHGDANGMRFGDRTLSARDVADLIRSDPHWNGRDVLLISCDTGAHPEAFAAQLSRELGVPVTAPDRLAWTDNQGRIYSSSSEHGADGRPTPTWPPDGGWHTFHPDGGIAPSGRDGFPPGHTGDTTPHSDGDHGHGAGDHTASRGDEAPAHGSDDDHTGTPDTHPDDGTALHRLHAGSPYAEAFDPPADVPVVHVPADDPRIVADQPFSHRDDLLPGTRYEVEGRGTFWTDQHGRVRWVEAETPNTRNGHNPDVHYPLPKTEYRISTEHGSLSFVTDENGNPPAAALFEPPTHVVTDPSSPPAELPHVVVGDHPGADASVPAPKPGEGFAGRTDLTPNTRYDVYDTSGNYVGVYTTDEHGHVRWVDTESGRQVRQHPELGANHRPDVRYRLSENFDLDNPAGPDHDFTPPPHTGETRITLDSKTGDTFHRRVGSNDPFTGRAGLEPNHKYVVEQKWPARSGPDRVEPYGIFYTDDHGNVVAIDTFRPFNPDLNNPNPQTQIRVNHTALDGTDRPTLLNTRHTVSITDSATGRTYDYTGTHSTTHVADSDRVDTKFRRDGSAQSNVGAVGRNEHPGTKYAGGHAARNAEGMMGEAAGQMPQLHAQNSGLNSDGVTHAESWYQMEDDRGAHAAHGATIGPISALGSFVYSEGTPRVMWQVWTESHAGRPPRLFIRSFSNVPPAAATRRPGS